MKWNQQHCQLNEIIIFYAIHQNVMTSFAPRQKKKQRTQCRFYGAQQSKLSSPVAAHQHAFHDLEWKGRHHPCPFVWNCTEEKEPQDHHAQKIGGSPAYVVQEHASQERSLSGGMIKQEVRCFTQPLECDDSRGRPKWHIIFTTSF